MMVLIIFVTIFVTCFIVCVAFAGLDMLERRWKMMTRVTTLQGARSAFMSPVPADFQELGFVMSMLGRKEGGPALEFVDLSKDFKDLQEYRMAQPQSYFLKYGGAPTGIYIYIYIYIYI